MPARTRYLHHRDWAFQAVAQDDYPVALDNLSQAAALLSDDPELDRLHIVACRRAGDHE